MNSPCTPARSSSVTRRLAQASLVCLWLLGNAALAAVDPIWKNLSSTRGELPAPPGGSTQQTGAVVGDFDGNGVNDFILSFRQKPPALVWYRRTPTGWDQFIIEKDYLTIEAGGAVLDIDGDGDLDVVFGGDWQSSEVWWWENPAPNFEKSTSWKRHVIKTGGKNQHHDQCFGDFLGTGKPQLVFWNQQARTLFLAEIPADPRHATDWPLTPVLTNAKPAGVPYIEGVSAFDVDADGKLDILACDSWFKHTGGKHFKQVQFALSGGLIFAGRFKSSKYPQIVISPGDAGGRFRWYECVGNPENAADWKPHDLLDREVVHGHSLQLGDINRDGHLDIFVAEMAKWKEKEPKPDHPEATAWILYGDGSGNFRMTELVKGHDWHEARLADLDGDGDLDLLNKPYTWETPRVDVWLNNGTRGESPEAGAASARPGGLMADSPVKFPEQGALPAKYPPDVPVQNEPAESDYYIFNSPCRSVEQIKRIQKQMPTGRFTAPPSDWKYLRRTRRALTEGGDLRILALGDSIINDTMRSGWVALLREAYPKANIQATVYVRGGGGCQHYREEDRVANYILPRKPDLVIIGGISQRDFESIREVIRQLRAGLPEVEILLATGAFGTADPRDPVALAQASHSGTGAYGRALKLLAVEQHCAYLDLTTPWAEYLRSAQVHPHLFYRDPVHANEYGEQVLAKILMAFWTAPPTSASTRGNILPGGRSVPDQSLAP